jgi:signal transduction histidine kinase
VGQDLVVAVLAVILTAVLWLTGWPTPLDRGFGDTLVRLIHRTPEEVPVIAVVIDDSSIAKLGALPWPRRRIAELVATSYRHGAAGVSLDLLLIDALDADGDRHLADSLEAGPSVLAAALGADGSWRLPHQRFGGAAAAAHVHAEIGPDGVVRTIFATKQSASLSLPAMGLQTARILRPDLAIEPGALLRPDFCPGPDRISTIPATQLLEDPSGGGRLDGKLVFIGVTATGTGDRFMVPTGPAIAPSPGVLVHASATASILRGGLIRTAGPLGTFAIALLAAFAVQISHTRAGALTLLMPLAIAIAVFLVSLATLGVWHVLLPAAFVSVSVVFSALAREAAESQTARRASGRLLADLLQHHGDGTTKAVPHTAAGRLSALRELQTAVLEGDAARRTLLDGMNDGVVMWDAGGGVIVVNPAAKRLWGRIPRRDEFGSTDQADQSMIVHRDGREIAAAVVAIGDGGMALLRDVTAERELERKRRDMQRLVSHELKTPLASIAGFGETLQRYELDPEEQQRVASLIRGESLRLGEMVATFLDLERLGTREPAESTEFVDLGALVEQRLEVLSETASRRDQRIVPRISDGITVHGSTTLLMRVVDNLVGNALKYSNEGDEVEISVTRDDATAVLSVTDHGSGIPEDALPRLFERFFRVPGTEGPGSGLGLAVAHEVVTWHGGCMEIDSIMGRGSTFTVRLPTEE